jgi:predicted HicB family RNase H-like nuclease
MPGVGTAIQILQILQMVQNNFKCQKSNVKIISNFKNYFKLNMNIASPRGGGMEKEGKYTKTLKVRIDPELLENVKNEAKRLNTDVSTYVRWCVYTGLYLKDLNTFIRSKSGEEEFKKP